MRAGRESLFIFIFTLFACNAFAGNFGFLRDGSYLTKSGIIFDPSCFAEFGNDSGRKYLQSVKLEDTSDELLRGIAECSKSRHFNWLSGRVYEKLNSFPRFTCKPKTCNGDPSKIEGCADSSTNTVNLNNHESAETNAGNWFHELLHLTNLDNQKTEVHNLHTDETDSRDVISFWERTCFRPNEIIAVAKKYKVSPCLMSLNNWHDGEPREWSGIRKIAPKICARYDAWFPKFVEEYENSLLPIQLDYERIERPLNIMNSIFKNRRDFDLTLPKHANLAEWRKTHCTEGDDRFDLKRCLLNYRFKLKEFIKKHRDDIDFCLNHSELEATERYLDSIAEPLRY